MGRYFYLTPIMGETGEGDRHPISEAPQLVGRSERGGIVLREPTVSRQHARIQLKKGEVILEDLGSKHGTFVNSRRIQTATLKSGDLVVFGLTMVFRLEDSEEAPAPRQSVEPEQESYVTEEPAMTLTQRELLRKMPVSPVDTGASEDPGLLSDHALRLTRLGGLCLEVLPTLYGRVTQLSALIDDEPLKVDALRATVEAVLQSTTQLMQVAARIAPDNRPTTMLVDVVARAVEQVLPDFTRRQIELATHIPPDLKVRVDVDQMAAVLAGLLTNAGNLSLDGALVEVRALGGPGSVSINILDQGFGYPPDVVSQAFNPLGADLADPAAIRLWEARRSVVAAGGSLSVSSNEGVGAAVRIRLPLAR